MSPLSDIATLTLVLFCAFEGNEGSIFEGTRDARSTMQLWNTLGLSSAKVRLGDVAPRVSR